MFENPTALLLFVQIKKQSDLLSILIKENEKARRDKLSAGKHGSFSILSMIVFMQLLVKRWMNASCGFPLVNIYIYIYTPFQSELISG